MSGPWFIDGVEQPVGYPIPSAADIAQAAWQRAERLATSAKINATIDAIDWSACRAEAIERARSRDANAVRVFADRFEREPVCLELIPALSRWSPPRTIRAVCESLLEQSDQRVSTLMLRGAIAYAERMMAEAA